MAKYPKFSNPWAPRASYETEIKSALSLIELLLLHRPTSATVAHTRELISACIWKITQANGKWNTRYCSKDAMKVAEQKLNHEHVFERSYLIEKLLSSPESRLEILKDAIGCIVTEEEHKRLTKNGRAFPQLQGWDRYKAAEIEVIDRMPT